MEAVEQDWRQQYEACYPNMRVAAPAEQDAALPYAGPRMPPGYALGYTPKAEREDSLGRLIAVEPGAGVPDMPGTRTRVVLLRSAAVIFATLVGMIIVVVVAMALSGYLYEASRDDARANKAARREPKLKLDAPRLPLTAPVDSTKVKRGHRVPRPDKVKHAHKKVKHAHKKKGKTTPRSKQQDLDEDERDMLNAIPKAVEDRPQCGYPKQVYCEKTTQSYFYQTDRDFCDSTFKEHVYVCNHSPNRFVSLEDCKSACIGASKPLDKCQEQAIFTSCNSTDLKRSYWYRHGKKCVEWDYPDGYCASKLQGVARSKDECRKNCLGPGTDDKSCTLPAELTCSTDDMKFPYFAHTFPNGTVACLMADAETLRPHKCMIGENTYGSQEECKHACSREAIIFTPPNV